MSYRELIVQKADKAEICSFLKEGDQTTITLRIPKNLHDTAKEVAELKGMSLSAFTRKCLIEEIAKGL